MTIDRGPARARARSTSCRTSARRRVGAGRCPDRRRRHGDGRGDRPRAGRRARRRGRDRPAAPADRRRACTRNSPTTTRGSASTSTTAGRFSSAPTSKYDLILFALPDSLTLVSGQSVAAARELPLHARGDGGGTRPPQARRRLRHVQLLPRGLADRSPGRNARRGVRPCAVRRLGRRRRARLAVLTVAAAGGTPSTVPTQWAPTRRRCGGDAGDRRLPVPLSAGPLDSRLLPARRWR